MQAIAYIDIVLWPHHLHTTTAFHSLLGFVISCCCFPYQHRLRALVGRPPPMGGLTNASRNLALKLHACLPEKHPSRPAIAACIGAYAAVLIDHLRDKLPPDTDPIRHSPNAIAARLFVEIEKLRRNGELTPEHLINLNAELTSFTDICGACERIKKTPIPFSYSLFLKKFIFVYIVSMPFVFVGEFGYWTTLFTTFMFYVLASLEIIAEEVEKPFRHRCQRSAHGRYGKHYRSERERDFGGLKQNQPTLDTNRYLP